MLLADGKHAKSVRACAALAKRDETPESEIRIYRPEHVTQNYVPQTTQIHVKKPTSRSTLLRAAVSSPFARAIGDTYQVCVGRLCSLDRSTPAVAAATRNGLLRYVCRTMSGKGQKKKVSSLFLLTNRVLFLSADTQGLDLSPKINK